MIKRTGFNGLLIRPIKHNNFVINLVFIVQLTKILKELYFKGFCRGQQFGDSGVHI